MAINISHPTNTIDGQDVLNLKSGNSSNIELTPDSGTVNVNGDINITGNFRVQGTTTTINSTTTSIVDPIIVLGTDDDGNPANANDGKDRGVSFFYNDGVTKTGFFGFDASNNDFRFIPNATITSEIVTGLNGTITINLLNAESVDTTILDAGDLNITTNVISSSVSGDIVIDSGADTIELIGDTNVTGNLSVSVDAVIYGNLTVQGTTTSINTTDTEITDNILVLNQGEAGAGVSKGTSGIEIARGSLFSATWKWNEATDRWEAKEGTSLTAIAVSEINAGNVNIANNTIVPTDTNGDLNLNSNGTGQVLINGRQVATDTDALMYAIVFGG
jgi:hypothetical protein